MTGFQKRCGALVAVLGLMVGAAGRANAGNIVVDPNNMNNWASDALDGNTGATLPSNPVTNTGVQFVNGPDTSPNGVGSVNLFSGNGTLGGDWAAEMRSSSYSGTLLSSLTALSYSTFVTSWNGQQAPFLVLDISFNGGSSIDDKIFFEPAYQTPTSGNPALPNQGLPVTGLWQTWNAKDGGWWSNLGTADANPGAGPDGVKPLSAFLALYPNATIVNDSTNSLGGVRLVSGEASPGDKFDTNVATFTIGDTTYNFEPGQIAAAPEPSTLAGGLTGALIALGYLRCRRRKATA